MLGWLVLLFVGIPLVELALLIEIGGRVGVPATIAVVVITGILGAALARDQGLRTIGRLNQALAEGRLPHYEIVEGIIILVAGAVLLTPGLITDLFGFSLLVPPFRRLVASAVMQRLGNRLTGVGRQSPAGRGRPDEAIDVDFVAQEEPESPPASLPDTDPPGS